MMALYLLRRMGPGYYLQARWARTQIPFRDKWEHCNRSEYLAFIARWNPNRYQKASQHKYLEKSVLQQARIATAPMIAYLHRLYGRDAEGAPVRNAAQLEQLIARHEGQRLCFKQAEGYGGFGFSVQFISRGPSGLCMTDQASGKQMTPAQWWAQRQDHPEGFVVEPYLEQHDELARINASSLNTLRVWVVNTDALRAVVGCYLRIGRTASLVDNLSSGGLWCTVDRDSGRLGPLRDPSSPDRPLRAHPDSGALVEGSRLPQWSAVTQLALDAIAAFPNVGVAGLDIGFATHGPVIVELNVLPDYVGCARMDLPLKQLDRRLRGAKAM